MFVEHQWLGYGEETESERNAEQSGSRRRSPTSAAYVGKNEFFRAVSVPGKTDGPQQIGACTRQLMREQTSGGQSLRKNHHKAHLHSREHVDQPASTAWKCLSNPLTRADAVDGGMCLKQNKSRSDTHWCVCVPHFTGQVQKVPNLVKK